MKRIYIIVIILFQGITYTALAQCPSSCPIIPVDVDLRASPNMEWLSPIIPRDPVQCCTPPSATARCVRFNVYTHPDAQMLNFEIYEGASPPGHSYSLNCGGWVPMGTPVCLTGPGPHCVLVCKPGGNENSFRITQSRAADISPPITIGEGCQDTIWVSGLVPSTIQWNVVVPGPAYNSYLSATSGVEEVFVASPPLSAGIPYFDVEVQGEINGVCAGAFFKDTVRINLVSNKGLQILPLNPVICYGGTPISLTAEPTGGLPPYTYLWNTGATTKSIFVGTGGDFSVQVWDATDCPVIEATTFVKTFALPISVDAGDGNVCLASPSIQLHGIVNEAQGGIWSGGGGSFSPSNTDLNAIYTLSAGELSVNAATLTLTSTGNWGCPAESDQLTITVSPLPFVNAGTDGIVCASTLSIPLNGQVWGDATQGVWTTLGTGSFTNASSLTGPYIPSTADISRGYVDLILSSIANGLCLPVRDTVRIFFGNEPIPNFTFPQPACSGKPIQFSDLSTVGWGIIDTWQWDFGNSFTSSSKNPTSVYTNPGSYNVRLQVTSDKGCTTEITKSIIISPDPVADFLPSQTCFGQAMNFTDVSTNASQWQWTFNNGTISSIQNPTGVIYPYAGNYDVTLSVTSAAGCKNTIVKPVTVLPKPNAEFSVGTICVNNPVTFQQFATVANDVITSWNWELGNGTTSTMPNPTTTYVSSTPVNVQLIVSTATCSDTIVKPVTPRALPVMTQLNSAGCSPYQVQFTFAPEANTVYSWNFGDGGSASNTNPTHVFINNTTSQVTYNVKTIAQNSYSCRDSIVSDINVYPVATANFNLSSGTLCSGQTLNLVNTSQNAVSYVWDFGDGTPTSTAQHPSHVYTNVTTSAVTYPITLTVTSANNCTNTIMKNVIVFPLPNNTITLNTNAACHPAAITFLTESGAQIYHWDFGDGTSIQGSNSVPHTYENPGLTDLNFVVTLTVTSLQGCVNSFQKTITVFASPIADFSLNNDRGCAPFDIQIQNNSFNSSVYSWNFGDGTTSTSNSLIIPHTFQNTTTALFESTINLQVESPSGCTDELSQKVYVYPEVDVNFILSPASGCNPLTVNFTNQSVRTNSYMWNFGDGYTSPLTNPSHTFSNDLYTAKTYTVKLTGSSGYGCVDSAQNTVTVSPLALAAFSMSASQICTNQSISFTNESINGVSYSWNFGDGTALSTAQHPNHTFYNTGTQAVVYPVTLTITSGDLCTSSVIKYVTVNPLPNNTLTLDKNAACHPAVITFHTESGAQSYNWNFGDGFSTPGSNVMSHTYNNTGVTELTYPIVLTVTSMAGCVNTFTQNVTSYPPSYASFTAPNICYENTVDFTDLSTNAASWHWVFNNGTSSTDQNPQNVFYSYAGTYNVSLTVTSGRGCESTVVNQIVVYPKPVAQFSVGTICQKNPITFQDNSSVNNDNILNWNWNFGDGSTSSMPSPTTTYASAIPANVSLIVSTAHCSDTITRQVEPRPLPVLKQINSAGCSPNQVDYIFPIESNVVYTWTFGDGEFATTPNPTHVFVNSTTSQVTYTVKVKAENNYTCKDSINATAIVYPNVVAEYSLSAVKICSEQQVDFTNNSVNAIGYVWDFGDGATSTLQNPSHIFTNSTTQNVFYPVTLIATSANLCKDTVVKYVTVNPSPNSNFTFNDNAACHPAVISMQAEMGAQLYLWDFGDGYSTSGSHIMTHTFNNAGLTDKTYTVTLTVTSMDGCVDSFSDDILVYASPIAEFTLNNDRGCAPFNVSIQNSSYNSSVFSWTFGDGDISSSNLSTITHTYQNTSTILTEYTIALHVESASGCINEISKKVFVYPDILVDFSLSPPSGCSPFTVDFTNLSVNTSSNLWIFGDGQTSAQLHPTHVFSNDDFMPKNLNVKLIGSSGYGCIDSTSKMVVVNPLVDADYSISKSKICSNENVSFTSNSINAVSYSWDFGDGSNSTVQNPSHVFVNAGSNAVYFPVLLIVTSQDNCIDSIKKYITVYPIPDFPIQLSTDKSCGPAIVTLTTNPGAQLYNWNFGDGTSTYGSEQMIHSFQNTSLIDVTYNISLSITTLEGCVSDATASVLVYPSPVADFDISKSVGCAPVEVTIQNNSINVATYLWTFGDDTESSSSVAQIEHEYQNVTLDEKVFEISLYVESISGCIDTLTKEVSVYPYLDIDISPSVTSGCSPVRVDFTNNSAGTDFYDWDFGDTKTSYDRAPSHIFSNNSFVPQNFTVQYIGSSIFGCADTTSIEISVNPLVKADFELSALEICSGDTIDVENTSINGNAFNWDFGNGQTATTVNPQIIFENSTTSVQYYAITLIVSSVEGCTDTIVKYVTVNPLPNNTLILSAAQACHPADITVSTASGGKTYYWDFGDGTYQYGSNSMQHMFMNQTTTDKNFTITLHYTSFKGCVGVFTNTVTVFPSPIADYVSNVQIGCSPLEVTFTNNSQRAIENSWNMLDETFVLNDASFKRTFLNNGTSQISYPTTLEVTSSNGCTATQELTINVYPPLQADFTPSKTIGCSPLEINFENKTIGGTAYKWEFDDGTTSSNFNTQHVYMNEESIPQIRNVYVIARSAYNCVDTSQVIPITINPKPFADFTLSTISGCSPFEISIQNNSTGASSYQWDFGNGTISEELSLNSYQYINETDTLVRYLLKLSAQNSYGCIDTSLQPISIFPEVNAVFDCPNEGCSPLEIKFTNTSLHSTGFLWNFGNGKQSSIAEPEVFFINDSYESKYYNVSLTSSSVYGCSGTANKTILVYPSPNPDFITSASYLRIPESTIGVTNLTEGDWTYLWTFGDGAKTDLEDPLPHTYNTPGEFQIILKASTPYCWDTISHFVTIAGARVYADYDSSMFGCIPLTVTFANKSRNAEWYIWNFGNGDTSTAINPTYTYTEPGTYVVELTAGNDEVQDVSRAHTVSVYDKPLADFEIAPEFSYLPHAEITTFNKSKNGYTYIWYFGDGDTSQLYQPMHEYTEVGVYDIALAVTSREGCYDSLMIPKAATVLLDCKLIFPNAFTPIGEQSNGYFNPELPEITNDIFHPVWQNIIDYNLQIFNRWGEIVFESNELERGWNGYYKDKLSKSDVYVWRSEATCWGGKKLSFKGNVTLLR